MGCTMRECSSCGYADGGHRGGDCPRCGDRLVVSFDEEGDHPPRGMSESRWERERDLVDRDHDDEEGDDDWA